MDGESWLEPRTRIPFVGIIAIVLIVAVVAVFVKTQLGPLFPESDITVQSADTAPSLTGRATTSSSFIGLREIGLHKQEYLTGVLTIAGNSRTFTIDASRSLLTIQENGLTEEILLARSESDPDVLSAIFDNDNQATRVDIDTGDLFLKYSEQGKNGAPIIVTLSSTISYEGDFRFRNEQYRFQFFPAGEHAIIASGQESADVPLTLNNELYSGTWQDGRNNRPVTVNAKRLHAVIEDVY